MSATRFNEMEIDAIGEIMNISLGASATTVSTLLGAKVNITTPVVQVKTKEGFDFHDLEPAVGVEISYIEGLNGKSVMLFSRNDVRIIVSMMMGAEISEEDFVMDEINAKMSEAVYQTIRDNVINSLLMGNKLPSFQSEEMLINKVLKKRFNTHENALFTCRTHQSTDEADERDGKPLTLKMEGWLGHERVCMRFLHDTPFEILCAAVNKRFIQQFFNGFYVSCADRLSYLEWKAKQKTQEG